MIAAHGDDCAWLHAADLRTRLSQSDRAFVNSLLGPLANLKNRFQSVQLALQQFLNAVEDERDLLDRELRDLHHDAASNKYEFEPDALDAFLNWMSRHRTHQDNAAYLMRDEIGRAVGANQPSRPLMGGLWRASTTGYAVLQRSRRPRSIRITRPTSMVSRSWKTRYSIPENPP